MSPRRTWNAVSVGSQDEPDCCAQARSLGAPSRRAVLKGLLAGAAAVPLVGIAGADIAYASPTDTTWDGDTLIVLSMRGGFDGLSAIVPISNDLYPDYLAQRPNIAVPQSRLLDLDGRFGMHPALSPLKPWYDQGKFGAVVAAGLPAPNRSHFEAMAEIEAAVPGSVARNGWLNRVMGRHHGALAPLSALQVGSSSMPTSLQGEESALGVRSLSSFTLTGADNTSTPSAWSLTPAKWTAALNTLSAKATTPVRESTSLTLGALSDIATVNATATGTGYPNGSTAAALQDVARLIKSGLGVKLVTLDVGDWDMHSGLGRVDNGWMFNNLTNLGQSLAAFAADLGPALDNVTLVTISEFGRRVQENQSGGLDHGWGNVMFVLGGHVAGVKGRWPGLDSAALTASSGDVQATTDYRAVLAEVLTRRCAAAVDDIAAVFPGYQGGQGDFPGIID
ncbi:MAG TPA: DUF1501 domain-containing protein [Candidatus Nanopelagicales bacterium]|jgi:uncharacterized protein (DUF1501 family)